MLYTLTIKISLANPNGRLQMKKLHEIIDAIFNINEVKEICFYFNLDYENLRGAIKSEIVIDLLCQLQKQNRFSDLQAYLQLERPKIEWKPKFDNPPNYKALVRILDVPVQLPFQRPEYFIGREKEIEQVLIHLHLGQKVTLWATGGMGKTAIASEVIYRLYDSGELLERFPDGVIFFSFYDRPLLENLYEHIIRTYSPEETELTFEIAYRHLSGKNLLLIYDGAEEADNMHQAIKLQGGNGLIITTRDRRSYGGNRIEVNPLPIEQARRLLNTWSKIQLENEIAEEICELIGRLPLSIRIAGRYLDETGEPPKVYLDELKKTPITELNNPESQYDSVSILLERTINKLDESTKRVLAVISRLAFLPFTLEPLQSVVSYEVLRASINVLNRYGIILRKEEKIQLVHVLIHSFAKKSILLDIRHLENLAKYWDKYARMESEKGVHGYESLHLNRPHIFTVLENCVAENMWHQASKITWAISAHQGYLDKQGLLELRVKALEIGIEAATNLSNKKDLGRHLGHLGATYRELGEIETAIKYHLKALTIAREIGDRRSEGNHLGNLGITYNALGDVKEAIINHREALAISREIDDKDSEGNHLGNLGIAYFRLGQYQTAIEYHEESLEISRAINDRQGECGELGNLGNAYRILGKTEKAIDYYKQALVIIDEIGFRQGKIPVLSNLGLAYRELGQLDNAIEYFKMAFDIAKEIGDRQSEGSLLGNLGIASRAFGRVEIAINYYEQGLTISREIGHRQGECVFLGNLANAYADLKKHQKALQFAMEGLQIAMEIKAPLSEAYRNWEIGRCYRAMRQPTKAKTYLIQAYTIFKKINSPVAKEVKIQIDQLGPR